MVKNILKQYETELFTFLIVFAFILSHNNVAASVFILLIYAIYFLNKLLFAFSYYRECIYIENLEDTVNQKEENKSTHNIIS